VRVRLAGDPGVVAPDDLSGARGAVVAVEGLVAVGDRETQATVQVVEVLAPDRRERLDADRARRRRSRSATATTVS
jgi:hypothetical protein